MAARGGLCTCLMSTSCVTRNREGWRLFHPFGVFEPYWPLLGMRRERSHGIDFLVMHMVNDTLHRFEEVRLTARQEDCIALVAKGMSSKEIARELGIAPSTVDNHISIAMHQFGFQNRGAVGRWYREMLESRAEPEPAEQAAPLNRTHSLSIPLGGIRNSLSLKERILSVVQIMILSIMATSAVITFVLGLIFILKLRM